MRMGKKNAVAKAAAVREHRRQPIAQGGRIEDIAGLHRPFDTAGIGEGADRKRWRQPGHQPIQRRGLAVPHPALIA
jgi:hypothetical protein